jgi:hypothetical protein
MKTLKDKIEIIIGLDLPILPRWLNEIRALERFKKNEIAYLIVIIKVRNKSIANKYIAKEIDFSSKNHKVELFLEAKVDIICSKCSQFGHNSYKAYKAQAKCFICGKEHETKSHKCLIKGYTALTEKRCSHSTLKCVNCEGSHLADFSYCLKRLVLLEKQRIAKKKLYILQQSRQKIAIEIPVKPLNV